jgi:hypothetical protein
MYLTVGGKLHSLGPPIMLNVAMRNRRNTQGFGVSLIHNICYWFHMVNMISGPGAFRHEPLGASPTCRFDQRCTTYFDTFFFIRVIARHTLRVISSE